MDSPQRRQYATAARLALPDVTVCAADCSNPLLAARALDVSMALCHFGDAILFSHLLVPGRFRTIIIPEIRSGSDYSAFMLKQLVAHIATPFVLVVQWDGYVLAPGVWTNEFRHYDYIGAKWPWHVDLRIGNGGFSFRSHRLLQVVAQLLPEAPDIAEDVMIGRLMRPILERDLGIRFAPEPIADRFSHERSLPDAPTFGFHGLFNLWRYVDDPELVGIAQQLHHGTTQTRAYVECVVGCYLQQRPAPLLALYRRWRQTMTAEAIHQMMSQHLAAPDLVADCQAACERLMQ